MRCAYFLAFILTSCSSPEAEKSEPVVTERAVETIDYSLFPRACQPYLPLIVEISKNPSREAALTEQESSCNPSAKSKYAEGLRQFTPETGKWLSRTKCKHLGSYQPYNEEWSLRCGVIYSESKEDQVLAAKPFEKLNPSYCEVRTVAEMLYNGGYWVIWEMITASTVDIKTAENFCGKVLHNGRKRSKWSCDENYKYPEHISQRQSKYLTLGGEYCK